MNLASYNVLTFFVSYLLLSLLHEIKAIAFVGSNSALLVLRSLNMSALAYGDEDLFIIIYIRRRGNVSDNRTILDRIVNDECVGDESTKS